MKNLISIEIDTIGIEKHTYIQTYMSIQERSKLIPIERISMIPIETNNNDQVYTSYNYHPIMFKFKMIFI